MKRMPSSVETRQQQLVQHAVLFVEQLVRDLRDRAQLFSRRHDCRGRVA